MKINNIKCVLYVVLVTIICLIGSSDGLIKRCFRCRSRGELGSCKDPFTLNVTQTEDERGVEAIPCASGWCGKIIEGGETFKDEYGLATNRMCLQRGPSDGEDRCAYTIWNYKQVYMCMCQGDLCNSATKSSVLPFIGALSVAVTVTIFTRIFM